MYYYVARLTGGDITNSIFVYAEMFRARPHPPMEPRPGGIRTARTRTENSTRPRNRATRKKEDAAFVVRRICTRRDDGIEIPHAGDYCVYVCATRKAAAAVDDTHFLAYDGKESNAATWTKQQRVAADPLLLRTHANL